MFRIRLAHFRWPVFGLGLLACTRPPQIDAPPPATGADTQPAPELPASTLAVPIAVDLSPVIDDLERAVPRRFGDIDRRLPLPSNSRMHVAFDAERGPFVASLSGQTATVSSTIRYRGRAWYDPPIAPEISASCGTDVASERQPRARITLASKLTLEPDWTLRSQARVQSVEPASDQPRDLCRVTAFSIDVTGTVMNAAQGLLEDHAAVIDHAVADIDLHARATEWWNTLQSPIPITDGVWLVIDPLSAARGALHGRGHTLFGEISLTARPRILVGPRPEPPHRALPDIQHEAVDQGLHILVSGVIDYDTASSLLTREFAGLSFENNGRRLTLRSLRLAGIGAGRLSLEIVFDGSARGHLYLVGSPHLDPVSGQIHVPDLDFDVASSSLLVRGLTWVRHGQLVQYLRERARLPVGDAIQRARELLTDGLNRPLSDDVRIAGSVTSVSPLGVYPTRAALLLQAHALATASLTVGAGAGRGGPDPVMPGRN